MSNEPSTGVGWEDPPLSKHGYDWPTIASLLQSQPMRWRKIFDHGPISAANQLRQGGVSALLPSNGFEFRTSNNTRSPNRTCTLYARFNPEKGT